MYRELDLSIRMIRDYVTEDVQKIVVDDVTIYHTLTNMLKEMGLPQIEVKLYSGTDDLFSSYQLDEEIESMSDRVVWLPGGGYLVFDYTEAMTVVDVNSGRYSGGGDGMKPVWPPTGSGCGNCPAAAASGYRRHYCGRLY